MRPYGLCLLPVLAALFMGSAHADPAAPANDFATPTDSGLKSHEVVVVLPGVPGKSLLDAHRAPLSGYWVFPREIMGWSCALQPPTADSIGTKWIHVTRRLECVRGDGSVAGRTFDYEVACGYLNFGVSIELGEGAVTPSGRLLTTTAQIQVMSDMPIATLGCMDSGRMLTLAEWELIQRR